LFVYGGQHSFAQSPKVVADFVVSFVTRSGSGLDRFLDLGVLPGAFLSNLRPHFFSGTVGDFLRLGFGYRGGLLKASKNHSYQTGDDRRDYRPV
jgi:hypothetical protein